MVTLPAVVAEIICLGIRVRVGMGLALGLGVRVNSFEALSRYYSPTASLNVNDNRNSKHVLKSNAT